MSKAEKLIARGRSFEQKGKLDRALDLFREATKLAPVDPEAWQARGDLAARLGAPREAADSLFRVSDMYARAGMPREALRLVVRVLELVPDHDGARRFRRMLESRTGEHPAVPPPAPDVDIPRVAQGSSPAPIVVETPVPRAATPLPVVARGSSETEIPDVPEVIELEADEPEADAASSSAPPVPAPPVLPEPVVPAAAAAPMRPVVDSTAVGEFAIGRTTGELALGTSISLTERLPSEACGVGQSEISLDDEPRPDVLHAVASAIGSSPLLSELDSDLVKHLIDAGTLTRRPAGEAVFKQGDTGTSLFLILAGEVAVVRDVPGETPRELARLRAGAFFGEMALITNAPRSATVRVLKSADLLEVSRRAVRAMIEREPRVLKLLMRFFRARLVGTLLQTSPVFEPFSREDRKKLVAAFRLRELGAGHAVFEEGSRAEGLFVLLAGRLEVLKGLDRVLGQLSPGDVFGEMSLLDGSAAMATVRAKTRSWVLLLPRGGFEELAARHPPIRGQLRALAETRHARNERELQAAAAHGPREGRVEPV